MDSIEDVHFEMMIFFVLFAMANGMFFSTYSRLLRPNYDFLMGIDNRNDQPSFYQPSYISAEFYQPSFTDDGFYRKKRYQMPNVIYGENNVREIMTQNGEVLNGKI